MDCGGYHYLVPYVTGDIIEDLCLRQKKTSEQERLAFCCCRLSLFIVVVV